MRRRTRLTISVTREAERAIRTTGSLEGRPRAHFVEGFIVHDHAGDARLRICGRAPAAYEAAR